MQKHLMVMALALFCVACHNYAQSQKQFENFGDITSVSRPDESKWQELKTNLNFSQVDVNWRITYNKYPFSTPSNVVDLHGWIGEEVNAQAVISTKKDISSLSVTISDLVSVNGNKTISSTQSKAGYVYYVLADDTKGVCFTQNKTFTNILAPDIIDFQSPSSYVKAYTNRPVWIQIKIPHDAEPGIYKGKVTASCDGNVKSIDIQLKVSDNKMPTAANKKFFLELWQYPVAEADFYKVKPWSEEHFKLMKSAMHKLKEAGEDVITASFFWDQFNPAVRDANEMFIKVVKTRSGSWEYDFTNFDKWVNFMMDIGINKQITVFGMATLNYRMYYYDVDSNKVTYFQQGVNGERYRQFWSSYLNAFEKHLKEKGWFDITTIGFSEKNTDVSIPLIKFIKGLDKNWKISYSGKYFPEMQADVYDYSLMSNQQIPDNTIMERRNKGFITTFYTACWEKFPNTFVMSDPVDATWLAWNAANRNMDGYLRYAYDYWTSPKMLSDVRSNIASGDRFLIYPDGNSSVRFEMLKDGIEDFEKIHVKFGNMTNVSNQFKTVLSEFDFKKVGAGKSRSNQIQQGRALLE